MNWIKEVAKLFIPSVLLPAWRKFSSPDNGDNKFSDRCKSWSEAEKKSGGYQSSEILEKVKESMLKVKNGEAAFERDSILFTKPEFDFPVLSLLFKTLFINKGTLRVLDFGGSLGTIYFQHRKFLGNGIQVEWSIVEQPNYVKTGKENFENKELKFFTSIEDATASNKPDVIILSSVLQYLPDLKKNVQLLVQLNSTYIIVNKTLCTNEEEDQVRIQFVPDHIYKASYPIRIFSYSGLKNLFSNNFLLLTEFDCYNGMLAKLSQSSDAFYKGFILEKKK